MKFAKSTRCGVIFASICLSTTVSAASLTDTLSSAASQLSHNSSYSENGGMSLSSLSGLLNGNSQSLSADSMNNAAGIMQFCAEQKLESATNIDNVKTQVLDKLGLSMPEEQKQDTGYMEGLQGLLNAENGQKLDLKSLGNTELGKKVKEKACDLVLKQGAKFLS